MYVCFVCICVLICVYCCLKLCLPVCVFMREQTYVFVCESVFLCVCVRACVFEPLVKYERFQYGFKDV